MLVWYRRCSGIDATSLATALAIVYAPGYWPCGVRSCCSCSGRLSLRFMDSPPLKQSSTRSNFKAGDVLELEASQAHSTILSASQRSRTANNKTIRKPALYLTRDSKVGRLGSVFQQANALSPRTEGPKPIGDLVSRQKSDLARSLVSGRSAAWRLIDTLRTENHRGRRLYIVYSSWSLPCLSFFPLWMVTPSGITRGKHAETHGDYIIASTTSSIPGCWAVWAGAASDLQHREGDARHARSSTAVIW